jgi:hypothetical protein
MVQDIAVALQDEEGIEIPGDMTRGEYTEILLTQVCYMLGDVATLTKGNADIEFILGIVGSYIITKDRGGLEEDTKPPGVLFDDILFPQIDTMEIKKEAIADGDSDDTGETQGEISKSTTSEDDN